MLDNLQSDIDIFLLSLNRYGSWAVCFTYGAWFGIKGLVAAGKNYHNCSGIRKACDFLLSRQRASGGWGESYLSCQNKVSPISCKFAGCSILRKLKFEDTGCCNVEFSASLSISSWPVFFNFHTRIWWISWFCYSLVLVSSTVPWPFLDFVILLCLGPMFLLGSRISM